MPKMQTNPHNYRRPNKNSTVKNIMARNKRIADPKKVINDLKDPEGWTRENNPHPAPDYMRLYPNRDGSHWTDYMEYFGNGEYICHACIRRAKFGSGNCQDNGPYFKCITSGIREKLRKKYTKKKQVQTKLI